MRGWEARNMDMLTPDVADTEGRIAFLVWLFMPFVLMALAIIWDERRRLGRVRRFRCRDADREVDVLFVGNEVHGCTAFDPPDAVTCGKACRNAAYRRQWEPALPVFSRRARKVGAA
jgi:hypothetical protein